MEKTGSTIYDTGKSQVKDHDSILKSENHNEAAQAGYKDNPYFSDYVMLHRTTLDSCGRRSMVYFHKPTGKIIPDTERSDDIPTRAYATQIAEKTFSNAGCCAKASGLNSCVKDSSI
jgi:hypothetical protein